MLTTNTGRRTASMRHSENGLRHLRALLCNVPNEAGVVPVLYINPRMLPQLTKWPPTPMMPRTFRTVRESASIQHDLTMIFRAQLLRGQRWVFQADPMAKQPEIGGEATFSLVKP